VTPIDKVAALAPASVIVNEHEPTPSGVTMNDDPGPDAIEAIDAHVVVAAVNAPE
jgi:hypothetical protein